jgi:hypothetical protein
MLVDALIVNLIIFFCGQFMVRCDHYMTSVWTWDLWFGYVFGPMLFLSRAVARKEKRNNY